MTTRRRRANVIKAAVYVLISPVVTLAAMFAGILMYFSGTFLPVYINGTYVLGNQVLRYELYALLAAISIGGIFLTWYGYTYLASKLRK